MTRDELIEQVKAGMYADHKQGHELFRIDLEKVIETASDNTKLYEKIAEQNQRINYLEMIEEDLTNEVAQLRTKLQSLPKLRKV